MAFLEFVTHSSPVSTLTGSRWIWKPSQEHLGLPWDVFLLCTITHTFTPKGTLILGLASSLLQRYRENFTLTVTQANDQTGEQTQLQTKLLQLL